MTDFNMLPEEMLAKILGFLPPLDILRNVSAVSWRWNSLVSTDFFWKQVHVNLENVGKGTKQLEFLARFPVLQSLQICFGQELLAARYAGLDLFEILNMMPSLKQLSIDICMDLTSFNSAFRKETIFAELGLKYFAVRDHDSIWFSSNAKVSSILRGSKDFLTVVKFLKDDSNSLHEDEMEAVKLCSKLVQVRVPILSLRCLKSEFLTDLTLDVNAIDIENDLHVSEKFRSLVKSTKLMTVKYLKLVGDVPEADSRIGEVLVISAEVFPNVSTLHIEGECWNCNSITVMVQTLVWLNSITIISPGFRHVVLKCLMEKTAIHFVKGRLFLSRQEETDACIQSLLNDFRNRCGHASKVYYHSNVLNKNTLLWL